MIFLAKQGSIQAGSEFSSSSDGSASPAETSKTKGTLLHIVTSSHLWVCHLALSDEEMSEALSIQRLPQSTQDFEIPLCSVCLEDRSVSGCDPS